MWKPDYNAVTSASHVGKGSHEICTYSVREELDRTNRRRVFERIEWQGRETARLSCCITTARAIVDSMTGSSLDPVADNKYPRDSKESGNTSRPVNECPYVEPVLSSCASTAPLRCACWQCSGAWPVETALQYSQWIPAHTVLGFSARAAPAKAIREPSTQGRA